MPLLLLYPLNLCLPLHQRLLWPPTAPLQPKQFFRATPAALSSPMCRSPTTRPFLATFYLGNLSRYRLLLQSIPRAPSKQCNNVHSHGVLYAVRMGEACIILVLAEGSLAG
uniref:Uncharacterized protein n=1 Tax=Aegilops tauschii TaxID=37682 RepID=M8C169_AEGTA